MRKRQIRESANQQKKSKSANPHKKINAQTANKQIRESAAKGKYANLRIRKKI
jgi:hypothetical protein